MTRGNTHSTLVVSALVLMVAFLMTPTSSLQSASIDQLREQITDRNTKIEALEQEIAEYQKELEVIGEEKQNLQGTIQALDISRNKLSTDIKVTQNRIDSAGFQINELELEIADKERRITQDNSALAKTIRRLNEAESRTLVETVLAHERLSDFWLEIEALRQFQVVMRSDLEKLLTLKQALEGNKFELEDKQDRLSGLRRELSGQKQVLDIARVEKDTLLTQTKNKESSYQSLLREKEEKRKAFEEELFELESQLRFVIDPASIPPVGSGVLRWPVDDVFITQHFGNTDFATENPQIYNGRGHNGVDFRASLGTRVKAALSGTVEGTGNTDSVCPNASFGKWALIKHNNGVSTLYAHLSVLVVKSGQNIKTGEVIGYSGNTGYSTGPHLHFGVYASQGVQIGTLKSRVCGGTYTLPLADLRAYLNPLSYL